MRLKIALRNLYISQFIIFVFLVFAYFVWFPYSFDTLGGFRDTARMLIFVDLVLGPLLVFIVYKKDKKHLSFDINVLLAIQLVAFIYGAYALYLKHPAYTVFAHDRFKLVNASYSAPEHLRYETLKTSFFSGPKLVYAKLPDDKQELIHFLMGVDLFGEPDIENRPEYYQPFSKSIEKVLNKQLNPEGIFNTPESAAKLTKFIKNHGGALSDYAFFPLSGNNKKEVIFVLNSKNAQPIGIIDSNPQVENKKLDI